MKENYELLKRGEAIVYDGKSIIRVDAFSVNASLNGGISIIWYRNADSLLIHTDKTDISKGLRALSGGEHRFKIDNYRITIKDQTYNSTAVMIDEIF